MNEPLRDALNRLRFLPKVDVKLNHWFSLVGKGEDALVAESSVSANDQSETSPLKPQPLNQDNSAPCMDCGSVQCAFCYRHIASALAYRKQWKVTQYETIQTCDKCNIERNFLFEHDKKIQGYCDSCIEDHCWGGEK